MYASGQAQPGVIYELARVYVKRSASESRMDKDEQEWKKEIHPSSYISLIRDGVNAP